MAPKQKQRPPPIDDPPTASSSSSSSSSSEEEEEQQQPPSSQPHAEEEKVASSSEEEASSEEGEEEEDEEKQPSTPNPPSKPALSTNPNPKSSSSDSDSDSESDKNPPKVKPLPPKPTDQAQKPKAQPKPASKRPLENSTTTTTNTNNNNAHVSDSKRAKTKATEFSASDDEDAKKGSKKVFQRLWSDEDELTILKGMVEFTSKTGQDPHKYPGAFHGFVKKSLHTDASSIQLKEKMRRLKKKYSTNVVKENPRFFRPHEQKAFELSKKVWGSLPVEKAKPDVKAAKTPKKEAKNKNVASVKASKPEKKPVPVDLGESGKKGDVVERRHDGGGGGDAGLLLREMSRLPNGVGIFGLSEDQLKRGLDLLGESKRVELERKFKKLLNDEMELFANRALLIGETTLLILEGLRSSSN